MRNIYNYLIICLIFAYSVEASADEFRASSDKVNAGIGDRVCITLSARSDFKIIFPIIPDSIVGCELISKSLIDTIKSGNTTELIQKIYITSFDSGQVAIPSFTFFTMSNGNTIPHYSNSVNINFSLLDISQMKDLKDAKSIIIENKTWMDYWLWYLLGLAGLIIGFAIYRKLKHRTPAVVSEESIPREIPKIPAEEWLKSEIDTLYAKKLWNIGEQKLHFSALSDAIRRYLELKYGFAALELTTAEIEALIADKLPTEQRAAVNELLQSADLVKFAKYTPEAEYCIKALEIARKIY